MLQPADAARTAVRTVARPRFEVTLPGGYVGAAHRVVSVLPQCLQDALLRKHVPDQVASVDRRARSGHEGRLMEEASD